MKYIISYYIEDETDVIDCEINVTSFNKAKQWAEKHLPAAKQYCYDYQNIECLTYAIAKQPMFLKNMKDNAKDIEHELKDMEDND